MAVDCYRVGAVLVSNSEDVKPLACLSEGALFIYDYGGLRICQLRDKDTCEDKYTVRVLAGKNLGEIIYLSGAEEVHYISTIEIK